MKIRHIFFIFVFVLCLAVSASLEIQTQATDSTLLAGRNVNMVSGITLPGGDPYLQRQNEPSLAVSTRNPMHILAGANDYRTVEMAFSEGELPGAPEGTAQEPAGDAWLGVFKSYDGGESWTSTLLPGYPQEFGSSEPIHGYEAAADPVVRAGTNGLFYYAGIAFNRETQESKLFVARYVDNDNIESGDPIAYLGMSIVAEGDGGATGFVDKPWLAVDIPRDGALYGNVYLAYSVFTGVRSTFQSLQTAE